MRPLAPGILIDEARIADRLDELARAITDDTPEQTEIAALVVLKGAFVFAADLIRRIPRRIRVGFLEIHKDPTGAGKPEFVFTHPFAIQGADVLLVEDILDTGETLSYLLERLAARRPERIRTVVLLDKTARRKVDVEIEYRGFEIPDRWVVGYGLDDGEAYRNLPQIRVVEEES